MDTRAKSIVTVIILHGMRSIRKEFTYTVLVLLFIFNVFIINTAEASTKTRAKCPRGRYGEEGGLVPCKPCPRGRYGKSEAHYYYCRALAHVLVLLVSVLGSCHPLLPLLTHTRTCLLLALTQVKPQGSLPHSAVLHVQQAHTRTC